MVFLFPQCGTRIKDIEIKNECKLCLLGKTYSSHEDISSCEPLKPCTRCSIGWKEVICPANLENGINEFKPCSACYKNMNNSNNNDNDNKQDKPISRNTTVIKGVL